MHTNFDFKKGIANWLCQCIFSTKNKLLKSKETFTSIKNDTKFTLSKQFSNDI